MVEGFPVHHLETSALCTELLLNTRWLPFQTTRVPDDRSRRRGRPSGPLFWAEGIDLGSRWFRPHARQGDYVLATALDNTEQ